MINSKKITIRYLNPGVEGRYQDYYLKGLSQLKSPKIKLKAHFIKKLTSLLSEKLPFRIKKVKLYKSILVLNKHPLSPGHIGKYVLETKRKKINFVIDAHDVGELQAPGLLDWAKVYFKSNYWPIKNYPQKVKSIVNCNPFLLEGNMINKLRALRNSPKKWDVVFVAKIWGGAEHNIRLFEELSKVPGKKYLYVTLLSHCEEKYIKRLEKAKVPFGTKSIPANEFHKLLASAKLVIYRAGKYNCISWRMLDLLAMGACIVTDSIPIPQWPVPLQQNKNYLTFNINRSQVIGSDGKSNLGGPGKIEEYKAIPSILSKILNNQSIQKQISLNNAAYFDKYAQPSAVGRYIVDTLINKCRQE